MSEAEAGDAELLGEHEWKRLLAAAAHTRYPCRDRSLLHLFWQFGATVRQVVALETAQVNFLTGRLSWPDGRESRLTPEAAHLLTTYVSIERDPRCPKLFCGRHDRPLTPGDVDRLFRHLSALAGVRVDPLSLRRSALFRLLRAAPLKALALKPEKAVAVEPERSASPAP